MFLRDGVVGLKVLIAMISFSPRLRFELDHAFEELDALGVLGQLNISLLGSSGAAHGVGAGALLLALGLNGVDGL